MDQSTRIKICGITNAADAMEAARLGADYLGFIFYPPSPRWIEPDDAATCLQTVRRRFGEQTPKAIGVFVDEDPDYIEAVRHHAGLDGVQFSGDEPPEEVARVSGIRFRSFSLASFDRLGRYDCDAYLCDTHDPRQKGGTGQAYDYGLLTPYTEKHPIIVAGGLTPETVGRVVRRLHPWGVDVSSKLEAAPGRKDHVRMEAFIRAVRQADNAGGGPTGAMRASADKGATRPRRWFF